ncbi:MAG TPA: hypothetical protein VJ301_11720 [Propionibacteriaceae bacterium]|nr:hypothetical protein [Propionibacteriaceae bacterium]
MWHLRTVRPDALPRADAYVLVRGTTGLYRHSCRACLKQTGDTVITWLKGDSNGLGSR